MPGKSHLPARSCKAPCGVWCQAQRKAVASPLARPQSLSLPLLPRRPHSPSCKGCPCPKQGLPAPHCQATRRERKPLLQCLFHSSAGLPLPSSQPGLLSCQAAPPPPVNSGELRTAGGGGELQAIHTCMQQLSMIMVSNLILGYSSDTSSQQRRNSPSPSFLSKRETGWSAGRERCACGSFTDRGLSLEDKRAGRNQDPN